ncbi:L-serine ammonia-lyase, iron-sulfur-dependent subunit beta [Clostridium estertheticum]|uniref:L-serine ammonia-lyase, iron-sulfur-dependent subunit beta n=1 Tax=Clostridium estertheticum TaxID=238834 RepID=UPI001CF1E3E3|nr:L-serine ammonia-lyase, iron-sulfur-dependent subunit beta [Clostridium estertheticum]MCB2305173.1 L-serine ammonia-lyase, iron-sulfur-dependent subunit beta [Clostridium estertheticum]MCB2343557.1 L-serine ammonia-lyase, iron-sulfur-dependent subunit beta [Clostridium estertheticum]MCB2348477.1 L-serine ammonia-lyase, iron-sulfur-dependent subunit beta [Clostridium estertheticum]WAG47425.1 L-serine ammonia-lyase, iron-sulfur-dependent subunit beta [Clostridium estertheticum]
MKNYSAFDILGPIMIGPSSSHTAGAARLAKVASIIAGKNIMSVQFVLHGSFAKTYKGHGTDKALIAGILGMDPWDDRLKDSMNIANEEGLNVEFAFADLGDVHPNTVKFVITKKSGRVIEIIGSSVGGGNILIFSVDGEAVEFTGNYPTIIVRHKDIPGMISKVSTILYEENVNIAFMNVYRNSRGLNATMVFETDSIVGEDVLNRIKSMGNIYNIREIAPLVE